MSLLVVYYDNYTTNYNQLIRINHLSSSLLLHTVCEDKLAEEELHLVMLYCAWVFLSLLSQILNRLSNTQLFHFDLDNQTAGGATGKKKNGVTAPSCCSVIVMIHI